MPQGRTRGRELRTCSGAGKGELGGATGIVAASTSDGIPAGVRQGPRGCGRGDPAGQPAKWAKSRQKSRGGVEEGGLKNRRMRGAGPTFQRDRNAAETRQTPLQFPATTHSSTTPASSPSTHESVSAPHDPVQHCDGKVPVSCSAFCNLQATPGK